MVILYMTNMIIKSIKLIDWMVRLADEHDQGAQWANANGLITWSLQMTSSDDDIIDAKKGDMQIAHRPNAESRFFSSVEITWSKPLQLPNQTW